MEYLPTNLPKYTKITQRSEVSSSVVSSGHVLLFSEDGESLTAKQSDGSYVSVGGSGTDVSDTTATAADVLYGKVFHLADGTQATGTIPSKAAETYAPTVVNQTIAAGQYLAGAQTIAGDGNLSPENIADGVMIFGVIGSYGAFYKCASVNTSNHSWTGYKAVLSNGIYNFESNVTSGLTYGSGFTPEVGKVYSDEARIQSELFGIPTNGLVFFAPLSSAAQTAETGQNLVTVGNVTYQNVNGIPCAYSDTTSGIKTDVQCAYMDPGIPKTMSVWVKITQLPTNEDNQGVFCSLQGTGGVAFIYYTVDADTVDLTFDRWDSNVSGNYNHLQFGNVSLNTWYHFVAVDTGTELRAYINGQLIQSNSASTNYQKCQYSSHLWTLSAYEEYSLIGYMASARIYNRALSAAEVFALSKEFTPSAS